MPASACAGIRVKFLHGYIMIRCNCTCVCARDAGVCSLSCIETKTQTSWMIISIVLVYNIISRSAVITPTIANRGSVPRIRPIFINKCLSGVVYEIVVIDKVASV